MLALAFLPTGIAILPVASDTTVRGDDGIAVYAVEWHIKYINRFNHSSGPIVWQERMYGTSKALSEVIEYP